MVRIGNGVPFPVVDLEGQFLAESSAVGKEQGGPVPVDQVFQVPDHRFPYGFPVL